MCIQNTIPEVATSWFLCLADFQPISYQHRPVQSFQFAISRVRLRQMVGTHIALAKVHA